MIGTTDFSKILGVGVNFPDGSGTRYEGTIVAAWIEKEKDGEGSIRVTVSCHGDRRYRYVWLENCQIGMLPKDKEKR